ncbi:ComF family protein [Candidatus Hydrogenosomobacter endosymbioticus]|nr:ComF family protein [Candidatus Hydrogenosomobacter endosymbioticus]
MVFPKKCQCCREVVQWDGICPKCWSRLLFIRPPMCKICGSPFDKTDQFDLCTSCMSGLPVFDKHRSLLSYGGSARKLVLSLKYRKDNSSAMFIAEIMLPMVLEIAHKVDYIIPVPLHWTRVSKRGFNQSALIARHLSRFLGIPILIDSLTRNRKTPSQGSLTSHMREKNVAGAFSVKSSSSKMISEARILLVDDVYTTGSTINACSEALKLTGAKKIIAVTLAKTTKLKI